jgi:RNA polymerase sigma factor (sigma-70 family)
MSPRLSELFLSSQSDERLVALACAGHERAFAAIVERYRPELQALARRLCADGRSEDVVQQAFLSAFAALRSGAEVKHLRGWLYRIVRNTAYRSRAPQYVPLDHAAASAVTVEDVVQQRALAMSALTELARLPARQRQAMVGTVGGMARSEVASTMGLSEGAVRQLVHRARSTLRTAVTAVTPWPMARWFAALGQSGSTELAVGAGAASSGGIMLKLAALVAPGTLATGVAAVDPHGPDPQRPASRPATAAHAHVSIHHAAPVIVAAAPLAVAVAAHSVSASIVQANHSGDSRPLATRVASRRIRHEPSQERSGTGHDGSLGHDGGTRGSDSGSRGSEGGSQTHGTGSFDGGHDGSGSGSGASGGHDSGGSSGTIATVTSRQDGGEQTTTQPMVLDSSHDGSSSDQLVGSGSTSGTSTGSTDGGHSGDGSSSASTSSSGSSSDDGGKTPGS